jgi:hypothetical protein
MQYSIIALLSLVAVAFAAPVAVPERADGMSPQLPTHLTLRHSLEPEI